MECNVNQLLYPIAWPIGRLYDPPLNALAQSWVPWDEPLSSSFEIHLFAALLPLYEELSSLSDLLQGHIQMVSSDTPMADRSQTVVVIHLVPVILLMELVSQTSQQVRTLERRMADAEATIQLLRQHLGI
jgi:hypothetical protein